MTLVLDESIDMWSPDLTLNCDMGFHESDLSQSTKQPEKTLDTSMIGCIGDDLFHFELETPLLSADTFLLADNSETTSDSSQTSQRKRRIEDADDYENEQTRKRTVQERNRISASRYRQRKKVKQQGLESQVKSLNSQIASKDATISALTTENMVLKDQLTFLKKLMAFTGLASTPEGEQNTAPTKTGVSKPTKTGVAFFAFFSCLLVFSSCLQPQNPGLVRGSGRTILAVQPYPTWSDSSVSSVKAFFYIEDTSNMDSPMIESVLPSLHNSCQNLFCSGTQSVENTSTELLLKDLVDTYIERITREIIDVGLHLLASNKCALNNTHTITNITPSILC